ncbi:MAG: hypothetical protein RL715_303 [Chloroflexota bacterium]
MGNAPKISDARLAPLFAAEAERFTLAHPRAAALAARAGESLLGGVPMSWMQRWASPVPRELTWICRSSRASTASMTK